MTNAEFHEAIEDIGLLACTMINDCGGDKSKIDFAIWKEICDKAKPLEEYV